MRWLKRLMEIKEEQLKYERWSHDNEFLILTKLSEILEILKELKRGAKNGKNKNKRNRA